MKKGQLQKLPWLHISTLLGIFCFFLATRLYHIQVRNLPIFIDEATYGQWALLGKFDATKRLMSLSDGLEPMFIWLTTIVMSWIGSPIIAGRLVSILSGLASLIGLYLLTKELFRNKWTAALAAFLYASFPFALILNRMAIYISLSSAFFIWGIYLSLIVTRYLKTETAFVLGFVLGGGLLTKITGFLNIYFLPITLLFLQFPKKEYTKQLFRWILLCAVAIFVAMILYSVLNLSSESSLLREKGNRFLYTSTEVLQVGPLHIIANNMTKSLQWMFIYFSLPWIIFLVSSLFSKERKKELFFLFLWFLFPFCTLVLLGKSIYPRYLFFMTLPLLPMIAEMLIQTLKFIQKRELVIGTIIITFIFAFFSDFKILTDFSRAPIPSLDLYQYSNGWPSGGGMDKIVNYLKEKSMKGRITVYSESIYGSLPRAVIGIFFFGNPNVTEKGIELSEKMPEEILTTAKTMPTYLIINQAQKPPKWPLLLIAAYQKGSGKEYIRLYLVKPTE